jgi:hypothetical protein
MYCGGRWQQASTSATRTGFPGDNTAKTSPSLNEAKPPGGGRTPGSIRCAPPTMNRVTCTVGSFNTVRHHMVASVSSGLFAEQQSEAQCPYVRGKRVALGAGYSPVGGIGRAWRRQVSTSSSPHTHTHTHLRVTDGEGGQQLRRRPQRHHCGQQPVCTHPPPLPAVPSRVPPSNQPFARCAAAACVHAPHRK